MNQDPHLRQRIAEMSARLMVQNGITDYQQAKYKAAAQLGVSNTCSLPSNTEIEEEILIYQRLFHADTYPLRLHQQRQIALQLMHLLAVFEPRLVGSILHGRALPQSDIILHLFTDNTEKVAFFLIDQGIPYELDEKRFRLPHLVSYPCYRFIAGEESVVLIVFGIDDIRWSPPSPINGKPMRRADLRMVESLLE